MKSYTDVIVIIIVRKSRRLGGTLASLDDLLHEGCACLDVLGRETTAATLLSRAFVEPSKAEQGLEVLVTRSRGLVRCPVSTEIGSGRVRHCQNIVTDCVALLFVASFCRVTRMTQGGKYPRWHLDINSLRERVCGDDGEREDKHQTLWQT